MLKNKLRFRDNCLFAGSLLQKGGYNTDAIAYLTSQLYKYWLKIDPFDLDYDSLRDNPVLGGK
ncbi:12994_t:CDS:1, partial [Entrophospora sp. SA101]